jgi:hypothetical protein
MMYRVQPSLSQTGQRVVVDSATSTVQAYNGNGDGAFSTPVNVHDGSCPDLSAAQFAFDAVDIGTDVNVSIPSSHNADDTFSGTITALAQAWFDRSGYSSTDWLGVKWEDGDSSKDEYIDCYIGSEGSPNACRVACTYHLAGKFKRNRVANTNLKNNRISSDNIGPI